MKRKMRGSTKWWAGVLVLLAFSMVVAGCGTGAQPGPAEGESSSQQPAPSQGGAPEAADKGEITIGLVNWAEAIAVSNLWKIILEDEGYTVKLQELDAVPLFTGLADGKLDFFLDGWLPVTHQSYWDEYKENLEDFGVWYEGKADLGLAVPAYMDQVKSIADLESNKDLFNGKITGIDAGAGIMKMVEEEVIPGYGLSLDLVASSEAAMLSALDKAYQDEKGIVLTSWRPHWMFTEWDLKYLEDPEGLMGGAEEIHTLVNKTFAAENSEVSAWLKNFKMTEDQLGTLESYIFNEEMPEEEAAKRWVEENPDVVNGWLAN